MPRSQTRAARAPFPVFFSFMPDFPSAADTRVLVSDGAMGTMLYTKGVFISRSFDELNLSHPQLVREINLAGARIAREAAGNTVFVAGAIGPLGIRIEPWGKTSIDEAREIFREQAQALNEGGVDLFILETFFDLNEVHAAMQAVRDTGDQPMIVQMSIEEDGNSLEGTPPEIFAKQLEEWGADVIGLNCSVGPHTMLDAIERIAAVTSKKLSVQPNAGKPRNIE